MLIRNKKTDEKIINIKAILTDVDGVLTDGKITYTSSGDEIKSFNVKDGLICSYLKNKNFLIGVITGRNSNITLRRCNELKFDFHKHGIKDKIKEYNLFKKQYNLEDKNILYIGDDLNDLEIIKKCGISVSPNDADYRVKEIVDIVTDKKGGEGVFREIASYILNKI